MNIKSLVLGILLAAFACTACEQGTHDDITPDDNKENVDPDNQEGKYKLLYTTTDGALLIPNTTEPETFGSTLISNTYENGTGTLVFDNVITTIGVNAFAGCRTLASITIPDTVTAIGKYAFSGCSGLTTLTIPEGVTSIGNNALFGCGGELVINSKIVEADYDTSQYPANKWLNGTKFTTIVVGDNITKIGNNAFYKYLPFTDISLPNGLTSIGDYAFGGCQQLADIIIPEAVTTIGAEAFADCEKFTSITIPAGVTSIGQRAFVGCSGELNINGKVVEKDCSYDGASTANWLSGSRFTTITIGQNVTRLGNYLFNEYHSLTHINLPNSLTAIGQGAFKHCSALTSITIPDSVTEIGAEAFYNCYKIKNITIPSGVTSISDLTFFANTGLTSITIPENVTTICENAFHLCQGLTDITLSDGVTFIGLGAFASCTSLRSITIPNSVTSIETFAFAYCGLLAEIYCKPTTPPEAIRQYKYDPWGAFDYNAEGLKIYVPTESIEAYKSAEHWSNYADAIVGYDFE